jgi:hypothetical protein
MSRRNIRAKTKRKKKSCIIVILCISFCYSKIKLGLIASGNPRQLMAAAKSLGDWRTSVQ